MGFMLFFAAVIVVIIMLTALLPQITGLAAYSKVTKPVKAQDDDRYYEEQQKKALHSSMGGYIPPDELMNTDTTGKASKISKKKIIGMGTGVYNKVSSLTEKDIPIQLTVGGDGLKKRGAKRSEIKDVTYDANPNNFDFDLDELIEEEFQEDMAEAKKTYLSQGANDFLEA